jgi:dTDP-glucose 4,6-dehydratase
MKKVVYVTGCLGFIGYHVTKACLDKGWYVIGVDAMTYAANEEVLTELLYNKNFKFIKSDINKLTNLYDCDYVINTAAETHVDNSIVNSHVFLESNVNGVHNLLQLITQKNKYKMPTLLHFSTDEVYGDIVEGFHSEIDLLKPSNPYSATKASADMLITAWARTFNVPYVIVRPTNNYGIGQYVEKLIAKTCKHLYLGKKIPMHENGTPRRTWLHVSDTADAIIKIVESETTNQIYNISGNYEDSNINVVKKIIKLQFGDSANHLDYINFNYSRQGQDVRYAIDDTKLRSLGWEPHANFDVELVKIVEYYKNNFIW